MPARLRDCVAQGPLGVACEVFVLADEPSGVPAPLQALDGAQEETRCAGGAPGRSSTACSAFFCCGVIT